MSEIGEKAEKIWGTKSAINRPTVAQAKHYASLILDVFEASNEPDYVVSAVIVDYDSKHKSLKCSVQLFDDILGEPEDHIYSLVDNGKLLKAMKNVNACEAVDCTIITKIYNLLVTDSQVTKYFEVTLDEDSENEDSEIVIKMRLEEEM